MKHWRSITLIIGVLVGAFLLAILTRPRGAVAATDYPLGVPDDESTSEEFLTIEDVTVFDLSKWRAPRWWNRGMRWSPVEMTDTLIVVRKGERGDYVAHYGTRGLRIDLDCVPAICSVVQRDDSKKKNADGKEYALTIHLDSVAKGVEKKVVVRGTYWNGTPADTSAAFGTYTTDDIARMRRLELHAILPERRPAKNPRVHVTSTEAGQERAYLVPADIRSDVGGRRISWLINKREPNSHYELVWSWP